MTINEIIQLFKDVEAGKDSQPINYALHFGIRQAQEFNWSGHDKMTFSEFLQGLADSQREKFS